MNRLPISCCYILKNEEEFLRQSIESVSGWISELIFVDSGSTDRTKEIALSFQGQVPHLIWKEEPWCNDFSAARNQAARLAKQPWILFVDGDEILDEDASHRISLLIRTPNEVAVFSFIQRNYTRSASLEDSHRARKIPAALASGDQDLFYFENWMERLYQRELGLTYEGVIHESLIPSCERLGLKLSKTPVVLHHFGRLKKQTVEKLRYYLSLTEQKWRAEQDHPVPWIELGINLMELQEFDRAFSLAEKAVQKFPDQPEILRLGFQVALRTDRFELAEKWIRNFLNFRPRDLYAKSQLTTALLYQGKLKDVLLTADEIFREDPSNFVAHLNCGVIYFEEKKFDVAARHLQIAKSERPQDSFVQEALRKVDAEIQKR